MVTLRAIAQHIENMCELSNVYYRDGRTAISMQWDDKIKAAVNMAFTCGYACTVWADPFSSEYCMIRVWNMCSGEVYQRTMNGYGTFTLYCADCMKVVFERKPHN